MKQIKYFFILIILTSIVLTITVKHTMASSLFPLRIVENILDTNHIVNINYPPLTQREGKDLQFPTPPSEHPRLYLNSKDVSILKGKINNPLLKDCWEKILKSSTYKTDGYLPLNGENYNNILAVRNAIESKAMLYLLFKNEKVGEGAIDDLLHYYETLKIDLSSANVTREIGRAIVTGSIVYDWCYPLLTKKEKYTLIGRMETLATKMEIGWPQIDGSSITGHTGEAQLSRDMLSLGIAVYNEKPIIYNRIAGRIFAEFVPGRKFFYPAGYHHQGSSYGAYRFNWDMYATYIFDKIGYPNLYGKNERKAPYYFIYSRRPDGQLMRNGDDYNELFAPFGKWWNLGESADFLAGSYFKDPIVLNEALKERKLGETSDYIFDFLFFNPKALGTTTKASLPLTRYFAEPFGAMIARTGWEDGITSPSVVAEMKIQTYDFANHQHLDAGSFQLYYKGPLSVQSGIYQGKAGAYGSEHFKNYSQRSIAHNTMLIYNPDEKFNYYGQGIVNDGGQQYPNNGQEAKNLKELLQKGYKTGEVLAHAFGPDSLKPEFSYLKGELAQAYSNKVKSFKRSFVFLNLKNTTVPAALIVFDNVTTANKKFKKYWLLHSVEEPSIDNTHTTIKRTTKGYEGKMINTTLLPLKNNLEITKTGGKGKEYEVFGKYFPQSLIDPNISSADSAMWRINVSPKKEAVNNLFLNVMQVMNNSVNLPDTSLPRKIETAKFIGCEFSHRIVLFSKSGNIINNSFKVKISDNGEYKVLITDISEGTWIVQSKKLRLYVKKNAQFLYLTLTKGEYVISKTSN